MQEPSFVILAAGMGSRYGGLKQMEPVDAYGNLIIDYSIYDAIRAGFKKVVFIIKKEIEQDFKKVIGSRLEDKIEVRYAYQELDMLPAGFSVPENRKKPWGTAHALLCAEKQIDGPFAILNADDYYGAGAFVPVYQYLKEIQNQQSGNREYALIGYQIQNTLTENGSVARGVCQVDENGYLIDIQERKQVKKTEACAAYSEDGTNWIPIPAGTTVSMNLWGFDRQIIDEIKTRFPAFLQEGLASNPEKCEFYLPEVVQTLLKEKKAAVKVLPNNEQWYGVTYKEDKPMVIQGLQSLQEQGVYPKGLWS